LTASEGDSLESIDRALGDNSLQHPAESPYDDLFPIMVSAKQLYDVAKMTGFSEAQAMQFARDYMTALFNTAAERMS
jgi:hypothetical protein